MSNSPYDEVFIRTYDRHKKNNARIYWVVLGILVLFG